MQGDQDGELEVVIIKFRLKKKLCDFKYKLFTDYWSMNFKLSDS